MLLVTGEEQKLLSNGLAVFGLSGRHWRPGWPSAAAGAAVIGGGGGRHWPVRPSSVARVATIGLSGRN